MSIKRFVRVPLIVCVLLTICLPTCSQAGIFGHILRNAEYPGRNSKILQTSPHVHPLVIWQPDGESPYGSKDNGTPRAADLHGVIKADHDCEASGTSKVFYTYHLDHLGSVRLITDEEGEVVWPDDFETNGPARSTPFGEQYRPSTRSYDGTVLTSLRFTSKEFDAESQLSDFGARFLEHAYPARFVTHDPSLSASYDLTNPQTFNLYTYCYNNPIRFIDPNGLEAGDANYRKNKWGGAIQMGVAEFWIGMIDITENAAKWAADWTDAGDAKVALTGTDFSGEEYSEAQQKLAWGMMFFGGSIKFERQIQKKFKHAADFGITGNYSKENAEKFIDAITQHINSPNVKQIKGTYRGDPVLHYLDPESGLNVITNRSGEFLSGWRLGEEQLEHVLTHGDLN